MGHHSFKHPHILRRAWNSAAVWVTERVGVSVFTVSLARFSISARPCINPMLSTDSNPPIVLEKAWNSARQGVSSRAVSRRAGSLLRTDSNPLKEGLPFCNLPTYRLTTETRLCRIGYRRCKELISYPHSIFTPLRRTHLAL